jgi:hypothetical protein
MRTTTRTSISRAIILASVILGCVGDVTSPGGGGVSTDPRECRTNRTTGWDNNSLSLNVTSPPCPFVIRDAQFSQLNYAAIITVPTSKIEYDSFGDPNSYVNAAAYNWYSATRLSGALANFVFFQQDPSNSNSFRAEPHFSAFPGSARNFPDHPEQMLDSLHVDAVALLFGNASAWKILPGEIDANAQSIVGTGDIVYGSAQTWRSRPSWDTTGYTYRWLLNGQPIANANGATYTSSLGSPGNYSLSNITTRADNTADTVTLAVTVHLSTGISGPNAIVENSNGHWDAVVSGGSGSYSYQWYADGNPVGSGASIDLALAPAGMMHQLELYVTDSNGANGSTAYSVWVEYAGCPTCIQP